MKSAPEHSFYDPIDQFICTRSDATDLVEDWMRDKRQKNQRSAYVTNSEQLSDIDPGRVEYAMGKFCFSRNFSAE